MINIKRMMHLCFIDDDKFYLETIKETIDKNLYTVSLFEDPFDFIEYKNNYSAEYLYKINAFKNSMFSKQILDVSIYKKYPIDIIFSDYSMPAMNGINLLKKCTGFYNVLLTSKSAYQIASEAFNNGVINYFSIKSDFDELIFNEIINKWKVLNLKNIDVEKLNNDFESFNEYYVIDNDGSMLIKNKDNYEIIFIARKDDLSIIEQILTDNGKVIPKNKIPIIFKDNIDLGDILFSDISYETDSIFSSRITNKHEINKLLSLLSNNE